jgi:hypothetical protein
MLRSIGDTLWCGAGGNGYLFYLTTGAATWTQVSVDVVTGPSIDVSDILSVSDGHIVGTSEGLYHSTNGGISWTIIPGFGTGMLKFVRWNNAIIATRTTVFTRWYYSDDEGQTWTQFSMTPLCFGHTVFDGRLYSGQLDGLWYMENAITSIDEPAEQLFTLFPNPTSHELNIQLNEGGSANYTLLDMQGRTVMSGSTTGLRTQLSLSHLVAGTYLLRVEQDGSIANERFVVQ